MTRMVFDENPMHANGAILGIFATVGMMYAARLAGMEWDFTILVGCCIGLGCMQGVKYKAEQAEKERQMKLAQQAAQAAASELESARARRRRRRPV